MELAVFTGDLVRSTELSQAQLDIGIETIRQQCGDFSSGFDHPALFSRNRGDGWQACIQHPQYSLRFALSLIASLRALGKEFNTRISIAHGQGEIGEDGDLNTAYGPVFVASGHGLDNMKRPQTLIHMSQSALGGATCLADYIAQDWTPNQARAVAFALRINKPSNKWIAQHLAVSRQAADQALAGAGFHSLNAALTLIEEGSP